MNESKLFFNNRDNIRLCGVLAKPEAVSDKCVILLHGLTGTGKNGEIYDDLAHRLSIAGLASFRFDFRGHGESGGGYNDITLSGEKRDLEAAVEFLKTMGYATFGINSASFAAGPTSLFLRENPGRIKVLVFWNPVLEYKWLFDATTPWSKANFGSEALAKLGRSGFAEIGKFRLKIGQGFINEMKWLKPLEFMGNMAAPVLFVHGDSDAIVPVQQSQDRLKSFKNARLEVVPGGDHGFHENRTAADRAIDLTQQFFSANL
ncbi:MAG: lysophospholipase [Candidatus Pacebacteria bacterium]|jgi:hypothetical protein|nr:lysophospholipase [Candidatus Paceibacterota bacterium]